MGKEKDRLDLRTCGDAVSDDQGIEMKLLRFFQVPNTFDPDDLRMRRILNTILWSLTFISLIALGSVFSYDIPQMTVFELLTYEDARNSAVASLVMLLVCIVLIGLNRSSRVPKNIVGWILVTGLIAAILFSDTTRELINGRSSHIWLLLIILSTIVLPPVSVFAVDIAITVLFAYFVGFQWKEFDIYGLAVMYMVSLLAWLGMSVANKAIRDARNEAEKNRAILNGVADGVVVLNENDQVVLANPVALSLMGSRLTELVAHRKAHQELRGRVLAFEWSDVTGVGRVAIVRDISRQVEVERAKDAILGVVSHEMRTPLAAIIGFAELLASSPSPELVDRIRVNAKRMITLVDDLLDHAQIQAGTLKMRKEKFSPISLANTVQELLSTRAQEKQIAFNVAVSESLPETLIGDLHRYQQILINLVGNAIKFTNEGGCVDVRFAPDDDTDKWQMVVSDMGIGIPPERLPDIFEPFRRASDYATRDHQGAGLGLSIAKKIAQLAGGDIQVSSTVGQGSTFTVTLPMRMRR